MEAGNETCFILPTWRLLQLNLRNWKDSGELNSRDSDWHNRYRRHRVLGISLKLFRIENENDHITSKRNHWGCSWGEISIESRGLFTERVPPPPAPPALAVPALVTRASCWFALVAAVSLWSGPDCYQSPLVESPTSQLVVIVPQPCAQFKGVFQA